MRTAGQNLALRLNIDEAALANMATNVFFPQPLCTCSPTETKATSTTDTQESPMDSPFTMAELVTAISQSASASAAGPDGIACSALRNLPDNILEQLLD